MGPTELQKLSSNELEVLVNISNSVNNQRLKFDVPAVFGLLNNIIYSDLTCGAQKMSDFEKKKKKDNPILPCGFTVTPPFTAFVDFGNQRGEGLTWKQGCMESQRLYFGNFLALPNVDFPHNHIMCAESSLRMLTKRALKVDKREQSSKLANVGIITPAT